jgi:hypothetical protein
MAPTLPTVSPSLRAAVILLVCTIALSSMAGCGGASGGRSQSGSGRERNAQSAAGSDFRAQRVHERKEDAEAEVQDAEEEGE